MNITDDVLAAHEAELDQRIAAHQHRLAEVSAGLQAAQGARNMVRQLRQELAAQEQATAQEPAEPLAP